jgi:hypothetical protein
MGDTPVVATLALGHDDEWPLFHAEAMIVIAPLGPSLALLIAHAIPVCGGSLDFVGSINRLSWRHADDYVIGTSESKIEEVRTDLVAHGWRESAPMPVPDEEAVIMRGRRFSAQRSADWAWRQNLLPGRPIQTPAFVPAWVELAEEKQLPRGRLPHVP